MTFSTYFVPKISSFAVFPAIDQNREDYVSSIETRKNENGRPEDGSKILGMPLVYFRKDGFIILAKN